VQLVAYDGHCVHVVDDVI